jgi:hypothetical protein
MAGKQSQANKNFWYVYALWQQKVAQALARRWAEALAKKRAEAEALAKAKQKVDMARLTKLVLLGIGLSVIFALFSLIPQDTTSKKDIEYAKPLVPEQSQSACALVPKVPPNFWTALACLASSLTGSVAHIPKPLTFDIITDYLFDIAQQLEEERQIAIATTRSQILDFTASTERQENQVINHISLGLNERGHDQLVNLTVNLDLMLNPYDIVVYAYANIPFTGGSWYDGGLTNYETHLINRNFSEAFAEATQRAHIIHFTLAGIPGNPLTWARQNGSSGNFPPQSGEYYTAIELFIISSNPTLCAKTIFYSNSGKIPLSPPPTIDNFAKLMICGS